MDDGKWSTVTIKHSNKEMCRTLFPWHRDYAIDYMILALYFYKPICGDLVNTLTAFTFQTFSSYQI